MIFLLERKRDIAYLLGYDLFGETMTLPAVLFLGSLAIWFAPVWLVVTLLVVCVVGCGLVDSLIVAGQSKYPHGRPVYGGRVKYVFDCVVVALLFLPIIIEIVH